jgi:hypothetical protein
VFLAFLGLTPRSDWKAALAHAKKNHDSLVIMCGKAWFPDKALVALGILAVVFVVAFVSLCIFAESEPIWLLVACYPCISVFLVRFGVCIFCCIWF